jgi:hypothetical protein
LDVLIEAVIDNIEEVVKATDTASTRKVVRFNNPNVMVSIQVDLWIYLFELLKGLLNTDIKLLKQDGLIIFCIYVRIVLAIGFKPL